MENKTTRGCRGSGSNKKSAFYKNFKTLSVEARQLREDSRREKLNAQFAETLEAKIEAMKMGFMFPCVDRRPFTVPQVFRKNVNCEPPLIRDEDIIDFTQMRHCVSALRDKHVNKLECHGDETFVEDLERQLVAIELENKTVVLADKSEHPDYVSVQSETSFEKPEIAERMKFLKSQPYARNINGQILLPYPVRIRKASLDWKQAFYDLKIFSFVSQILIQVGDYGHTKMTDGFKEALDSIEVFGLQELFLRDNPVVDVYYEGDLYVLYPVFADFSEKYTYIEGSQNSLASQHELLSSVDSRKIINMAKSAHAFVGTRMHQRQKELRIQILGRASQYWKRRLKVESPPCCSSNYE